MFQWICLKHAGTPWHPIEMCHGFSDLESTCWSAGRHYLKPLDPVVWQSPTSHLNRPRSLQSPACLTLSLERPGENQDEIQDANIANIMDVPWFSQAHGNMEGKFIFRIHFMQCDAVPVFLCFSSLGEGWLCFIHFCEQATLPRVQTVTVLKALQALQGLAANTRNTARCIMLHYCASCRHVVFDFSWLLSWIGGCSSTLMPTRLWWKVWGNYSTFAARCTAKNRATK